MKPIRLADRGGRGREIRVDGGAASLDGRTVSLEVVSPGEVVVDGRRYRIATAREGSRIWVWCEGAVYEFDTARKGRTAAAADHHAGGLDAPMPGRVRRLVAREGERVAKGDVLLVLEAMKMEHAIRAPHDGVLERFHVAEGALVDAGVELAEIKAGAPSESAASGA